MATTNPAAGLGRNSIIALISSIIIISGCVAWFFFFKTPNNDRNPAFAKYIESYTSGVILKNGTIKIQLAGQVKTLHSINQPLESDVLDFSPGIEGKAYWLDERTIEFKPSQNLEPGKIYDATFELGRLVDVNEDLQKFKFSFQVVKPSFKIEEHGLRSINSSSLDYLQLTGNVLTSDIEKPADIEKLLFAEHAGKSVKIKWLHNQQIRSSTFTVDSILMGKKAEVLKLSWNGAAINADLKGSKDIEVPAKGVFKVLDINAVHEPEQYVLIQLSNPVMVAQDLSGLISVNNITDLKFTIEGSEIKVYTPDKLEGNYAVKVNEGIENIVGQKLKNGITANISFENMEPSIKIPGKGMIIPDSGKLTYPFEAVNLKAVDVTIIKINENNVSQFFQVNNMDGNNELRRVGKPLVQKTIWLDEDKAINLKRKNRFALDIDQLIKTEPGAIYRITIGFRKSYSLYTCSGNAEENAEEDESSGSNTFYDEEGYYPEGIDEDDDFWQRYNSYYPMGYNWDEKDNPCSASYYSQDRWVSRNVIASNIGLIAKRGTDNSVLILATDIMTTAPMSGVEIKLVDYQNQILETGITGDDGTARVELKRKPYLLLASKGAQRGYLKLDDGTSLPLSRFNVSGDVVQNGIKGFIYGERGVWRPGDSVFVSFILENKAKDLPPDLPIIFELYTPQGQLNKKLVQNKGLNGFYSFKVNTEAGAPTGNWLAKVKVGGAVFSKPIKIETIMPNRLKINLNFPSAELGSGKNNKGILSAKWLFGATAKNLKAKIDATLVPAKTAFKNFPKYTFDDPTSAFEAESKTVFDGTLNESGLASVTADLNSSASAPGVLKANFLTRVFEPGGNFSIDNFSMPYHVYDSYAGVRLPEGEKLSGMLMTDRDHVLDIANVNADGKLLAGRQRVQIELYKIQWRWWWDEGEENLSNFTQDNYNQLIKKETITLTNGQGRWNLRINYPEWGRYLVRIKDLSSGHTTGETVYIDWPGWQQREQQNNPTEASMLSFNSNKEKYKVGEEVVLTIPSSKGGRGLVSIESGSKVLKTWWIETQSGQTKYSFKVEKEMAPNIYVNVTLLQPHSQTINDLPIRMYGVIPILVEDPQTILKPVIKMAPVIRPETNTSISVSESSGKAMTYTIAIVDEGLLDLTRFKTPDPHSSFYAREALGVKTWDLFDHIVGAWGGDLARILSIGGDGNINRNVNPAKANRFKPVVKYLGPFSLRAGSSATHQFKLPQYIGSVRAMVIAGQDGAYGFTEKAVEVKKPLMLLATLPRVAGPGETFRLPVTVFAMEKGIRNVSLEVQTNGLLSSSRTKQNLSFSEIGEKMIYADVKVKDVVGIAKIKIIARSGREQAVFEVEMDIRNPKPYITSVDGKEIAAGKSWTSSYSTIGMSGTNSGQLEISAIPPMNLTKRLSYLIKYPHGCVEQTVSAVFPQLVLNQLTDLSPQQKAQVERNVKNGINKIRTFQTVDGGLAYWPGEREADEWGTNYGGHFLVEAQKRGYSLPAGVLEQWKRYQSTKANAYAPSSTNFYGGDLMQAYRLYLLALAKKPEIGAMNRLREFQYLSDAGKWRLAAAYMLIGQEQTAAKLINGLSTSVKPYQQMSYTYGSDVRDEAMILETLTEMGRRSQASALVNSLAARLAKEQWLSTQATAYALIAISKYCGVNKNGSKMSFSYSMNGAQKAVQSASYLQRITLDYKAGKSAIGVKNNGSNVLYVRVIREGQALQGEDPPQKNNAEVLAMNVIYKTLNGRLIDPVSISQGTDFVAEVTVNNPGKRGNYDQMALTQIFPSGWEIINTRLSDNSGDNSESKYTYRDIRDDRVLTYFNIPGRRTLTYQVLLNASYLGRYYLPSVSCAAMYDNDISAVNRGKWVEVVK
ncbi:MAG TPA: MG2 domain-containing protein [Sphingobacteriaceae bacterium]